LEPVGDTSTLRPTLQAWTDSRQTWLELGDELEAFERQP
jgi:hypothetical protein